MEPGAPGQKPKEIGRPKTEGVPKGQGRPPTLGVPREHGRVAGTGKLPGAPGQTPKGAEGQVDKGAPGQMDVDAPNPWAGGEPPGAPPPELPKARG